LIYTLSSIRKAALRWGLRLVLKMTNERLQYTEYWKILSQQKIRTKQIKLSFSHVYLYSNSELHKEKERLNRTMLSPNANVTCHSIRTNHGKYYQLWMPYRIWCLISVYFYNVSMGTTCVHNVHHHHQDTAIITIKTWFEVYTRTFYLLYSYPIHNVANSKHPRTRQVHNWTSPSKTCDMVLYRPTHV